ncbi:hypothetical protein HJG60_010214 [Phyllostomus discolor]|uniref:Uncharacterized protein n=1 Tax=Phyllostomus discolor TaxID=89673 RepID=A0A834AY46_9CHIR|nr:hypothetical protein HJG60_010214 [Phyllostomus discolor]
MRRASQLAPMGGDSKNLNPYSGCMDGAMSEPLSYKRPIPFGARASGVTVNWFLETSEVFFIIHFIIPCSIVQNETQNTESSWPLGIPGQQITFFSHICSLFIPLEHKRCQKHLKCCWIYQLYYVFAP